MKTYTYLYNIITINGKEYNRCMETIESDIEPTPQDVFETLHLRRYHTSYNNIIFHDGIESINDIKLPKDGINEKP